MNGVTGSLWVIQINTLSSAVIPTQPRYSIGEMRIIELLDQRREVTVRDVVKALGIPDISARRMLDAITPAHARIIEGRPRRWRKIANEEGLGLDEWDD